MKVSIVRNILEANDRIANQNREIFERNGLFVINLMSSPGGERQAYWKKPSSF